MYRNLLVTISENDCKNVSFVNLNTNARDAYLDFALTNKNAEFSVLSAHFLFFLALKSEYYNNLTASFLHVNTNFTLQTFCFITIYS